MTLDGILVRIPNATVYKSNLRNFTTNVSVRSSGSLLNPPRDELDAASTKAEGGLSSEAGVIQEQARQIKPLHDEENLLRVGTAAVPPT